MPIDVRALARPLLVLAAAAVLVLTWGSPASAHTELRATTPEQGSTVDQLSEVRLEFTGDLLEIGAELTLVDAAGTEHELVPQFPSANAVTGTVEDEVAAGDAELRWRIVAEDGHPIEGVLAFTYAGPVETETPVESPTPADDEPIGEEVATSSTPEATPSPTAPADPDSGAPEDIPAWVLPLLGVVAAGGALVAILAARARQR
ncbi:copper resistance CopC family protein [Demequina muriae]|uniref:Copper resistance protein CopC n=1 Tax=Demequina muriae TaxID=3051664 RepID=A0ABT8GIY7_9MICO|nr:copper resistance CopC family protein [Demequina sp. EGI L300058]MDN4481387.1 copper resistance protein CopC [Demequina sp. EGI L300058]